MQIYTRENYAIYVLGRFYVLHDTDLYEFYTYTGIPVIRDNDFLVWKSGMNANVDKIGVSYKSDTFVMDRVSNHELMDELLERIEEIKVLESIQFGEVEIYFAKHVNVIKHNGSIYLNFRELTNRELEKSNCNIIREKKWYQLLISKERIETCMQVHEYMGEDIIGDIVAAYNTVIDILTPATALS